MEDVEIGVVVKPHGVRGALRVKFHNPSSPLLRGLDLVTVCAPDGATVEQWPVRGLSAGGKGVWILTTDQVDGRSAAEARRGWKIMVSRDRLPPLDDDEFYYHEVPGYAVTTPSGRALGTVRSVVDTHVDILQIDRVGGGEWLIPAIADFVESIDTVGRRVVLVEDVEDLLGEDPQREDD